MSPLEQLVAFGLEFNRSLEAWRSPLGVEIFQFFSFLGSSKGYFILIPLLYWLFSGPLGLRLLYGVLASNLLNHAVKEILQLKRPLQEGSITSSLDRAESYSFPSGHSQVAAFFGVYLWLKYPRKRIFLASVFFIFMVGFSRLYLGVHFFFDVMAGWLLGGLTAWGFFLMEDRLAAWERNHIGWTALGTAFICFVAMIAWSPAHHTAAMTGGLFGLLAGAWRGQRPALEGYGRRQKAALCLYGSVGAVCVFLLTRKAESLPALFAAYALATFWVSAAVPWSASLLFRRVKI